MHNISFNDGLEEIMINNDPERVIKWNPTDSHFSKRYFDFTDYVKGLYDELMLISKDIEEISLGGDGLENEGIESSNKGRESAEKISELGAELSTMLDKTFNSPISEIAFRGANPLSPTRDGKFLFDNFLSAIAPIVSDSVEAANKASQKRVGKYTQPVRKASKRKNA